MSSVHWRVTKRVALVGLVGLFLLVLVYLGSHYLDAEALVRTLGLFGVVAIIFAESGLLIGFFLPGDSLLFTAGILASQGLMDIRWLVPLCFAAAVTGDSFGYWFGRKIGPALFRRQDSLIFHKDHLEKAHAFYKEHGGKTLIFARFMPVIRTFAPIVAGVAKMDYRSFLLYNIVGALLWAVLIPLIGYYLGTIVPNIERYIIPGVLIIIVSSIAPPLWQILKDGRQRQKMIAWLTK